LNSLTAPNDAELLALAGRAGAALCAAGCTLAAAESCTGGWLSKALTDVAGSSSFFTAGFATYSNESKQSALGVSVATLATHGAVSREVVLEMALGARHAGGADLAVAISGVAGPTGGTADKPVGTVWFGIVGPNSAPSAEKQHFGGNREAVRRQAVSHALLMIQMAAAHSAGAAVQK
jgi:nicotinamide-nucleotide amidase